MYGTSACNPRVEISIRSSKSQCTFHSALEWELEKHEVEVSQIQKRVWVVLHFQEEVINT